jgi:hypothetical protein
VPSHQISEYLSFAKEETEEDRIGGIAGVVTAGDTVSVKIVEIRDGPGGTGDNKRVTGSMKLCDQQTGEDLDPDNTKYRPRDGGDGGGFNKDVTKNAAGDAVRPGGVIDWGHHLGDVKQMTSGGQKGYDLLEHDVNQERAMAETRFDGKYFRSPHSAD